MKLVILISALIFPVSLVLAEEAKAPKKKEEQHDHDEAGHKHSEAEEEHEHEAGAEEDEHGHGAEDEHGHGEKDGHGHEEGGGSAIGPGKGITEKGALGIKLSPEALKTISPKAIPFKEGSISIPYTALVRIKATKSVYRVRDSWYKRVPVEVVVRQGENVIVRSGDLKSGDEIVVSSAGFLRTAEVIAEEGASHSHAH